MTKNRVIGVELVVDDKGTVKVVRFSKEAQAAFAKAAQGAGRLDSSMKQADGAMARLERRAGTLTGKMALLGGAFTRLRQAGGMVWGAFRRVSGAVFNLKTALVGLGLGYVAKGFLDVATSVENYTVRLTTLLGSQQLATKAMNFFQQIAAKVPFTLGKVVEAGTSLEAFGAKHNVWLKPLTDLAAVMGIDLPEAAQALGRAYAGGAGAADIFRERGILNIIKETAKLKHGIEDITKLTLPQFRQLMLEVFTDARGKIAGAAKRLSKTWDGMISMLSDAWFRFRQKIMDAGVFDYLKDRLQGVLDWISDAEASGKLQSWAETLSKGIVSTFETMQDWLGKVTGWWEKHGEDVKTVISGVITSINAMIGSIATVIKWLQKAHELTKDMPGASTLGAGAGAAIGGKVGGLPGAGAGALLGFFSPGIMRDLGKLAQNQWPDWMTGQWWYDWLRNTLGLSDGSPARRQKQALPGAALEGMGALDLSDLIPAAARNAAGAGAISGGLDFRGEALGSFFIPDLKALDAAYKQAAALEKESAARRLKTHQKWLKDVEKGLGKTGEAWELYAVGTEKDVLDAAAGMRRADYDLAQTHEDYALAMARATGDSLGEQQILHGRFIREWTARGLERGQAEELWQAEHVKSTKSMLDKTLDAWMDTDKLIEQGSQKSLEALYRGWQVFWTDVFNFESFENTIGDFFQAILDAWKQLLVQMTAQWSMAGIAGIFKDLINLLKGGSGWENTLKGVGLDSLLGGGKTASSAAGAGGVIAGAKALFGGGAPGAAELGFGLETGAASMLYAETLGQAASLGIGGGLETGVGAASGLSAMAGPAAAALGPGLAGMLISQTNLFGLGDSPWSAEEAQAAIQGYIDHIKLLSEAVAAGRVPMDMYGESTKEAAAALEKWAEVAGYSKEQVDALVASTGPLGRAMIEAGQAANTVDNQVRRLTDSLRATQWDGFEPGADRAHEFADGLRRVAADSGLSEAALGQVTDKLKWLEQQAVTGEISLSDMAKAFRDELLPVFGDGKAYVEDLTRALNDIPSEINTRISVTRVGETYEGVISQARGAGALGIGSFHQGGPVLHGGGFPFGGPWASYEKLMRLAGDEVVAKLRLGEYVIREQAVNAATLPWLDFVNREARPPVIAEPVVVPLAVQAPAPGGGRTVIFQEGAITVVVPGAELDEDQLALRLRDRLQEMEDNAFKSA